MFFLVNEKNVSSALKLEISAKLSGWIQSVSESQIYYFLHLLYASSIYCQSMNLLTFRLCCLFYIIFSGEKKWED